MTRRGVREPEDAQTMANWAHRGGSALDASVCIEGAGRPGLERLLCRCARPAFAQERLRQIDAGHLVYESIKAGPGGSMSLMLTPRERAERLAALIPPPRQHRNRYYGVPARNAPLQTLVRLLYHTSRPNNGIFDYLIGRFWPIVLVGACIRKADVGELPPIPAPAPEAEPRKSHTGPANR